MKRAVAVLLVAAAVAVSATAAAGVALAQGGATDQYAEPGAGVGGEPRGTTDDAAGGTATLGFRLETEGQPPEDATFFGLYGPPESEFRSVRLTDPDGDGVYTGAVDLEGGRTYAARLVQGTGTRETEFGTFPVIPPP